MSIKDYALELGVSSDIILKKLKKSRLIFFFLIYF